MPKIVSYNLAYGHNVADLERTVEELIEAGWQPLGGVCVVFDPTPGSPSWNHFQAMVKYEA